MIKRLTTNNWNKTTFFMLPLLDVNLNIYSSIIKNVYLGNSKYENLNDKYYIFLETDVINDEHDFMLLSYLQEHDEFVCEYNNILVLRIPVKYQEDYNKFLLGKYHAFSNEAKNIIVKNCYSADKDLIRRILSPSSYDFVELWENIIVSSTTVKDDILKTKTKIYNEKEILPLIKNSKDIYSIVDIEEEFLNNSVDFKENIEQLQNA